MRMTSEHSGIETLDRASCLRLLASEVVGRVAFINGGRPELLPVNYVLDGESIVFRTKSDSILSKAGRGAVAFEVDITDRAACRGSSVVVHGLARSVDQFDRPDLVSRLELLELHPWASGTRDYVVRITPITITGRRVGLEP